MTSVSNLSPVDSVSGSYQIPVEVQQSGDLRKMSVDLLVAFIQESLTSSGNFQTQYAAPAATGFNVALVPVTPGGNLYLLLTPVGAYAAGTITLPTVDNVADGQEILCNTTQAVTTLTTAGSGATVVGAPTTLAANAFFRLRYNLVLNTWYRVG
ncbi:MAG: hypothetical protein V4641_21585 [Pseudomonadota bacterium]